MDLWNKFVFSIRSIGLKNSLMTIYASLLRDWQERRFDLQQSTEPVLEKKVGSIKEVRSIPSGAVFSFENAEMEVVFLAPDLVRITWTPGELPLPYALTDNTWEEVKIHFHEDPNGWDLSSSRLTLVIDTDGCTEIYNRDDQLLREEKPPVRIGTSWIQESNMRDAETIHGLGERATSFNLRGGTYQLWNHESSGAYDSSSDPLYVSIPVYHSIHQEGSYLIFYENSHKGNIRFPNRQQDSQETHSTVQFLGGALRYYITPGTPDKTLERYTRLTGRAPLPPKWSLGYHQCRWGYKSEADIREVVQGFETRGLPLRGVHLDIDYMDDYRVFTVDKKRFPDLAQLSQDMKDRGIELVTILDPGVKVDKNYSVYREGMEKDVFVKLPDGRPARGRVWPGWCVFPDFTSSKTREWWRSHYAELLQAGIRGFWHDMNEPSAFAAWGLPTLPKMAQYSFEGRGGNHIEANNLFGLLNIQAGYQALREHKPEQRPWILSRSGWAGMQRYAWNWTGDVETSWDAMRTTLRIMLGLGLSGIPYSGSDIGGFGGHPDAELFTRWFQMAALNPFFRGHSAASTPRREPWVYDQATTEIVRKYLEFRVQLIPYLYTLAWQAHQTGHPLMRPLFWLDEPELTAIDDAFLLGESLLVAPVMEPGATHRSVQIPGGTWYGLWDNQSYNGPASLTADAPIDQIPVFVRGGKVLPLADGNNLHLHAYASPSETEQSVISTMYSDAGDGYGAWRVDRFHSTWNGTAYQVTRSEQGDYPFPYDEITVSIHGFKASTVIVDGEEQHLENGQFTTGLFNQIRFMG